MELKIKYFRKQMGYTAAKLSNKLNIAQSTLTHYENGNRDVGTEMLCKIADILKVSVDELLGREVSPNEELKSQTQTVQLSQAKNHLIETIKQLSDENCSHVEAFIVGLLTAEEEKQNILKRFNKGV